MSTFKNFFNTLSYPRTIALSRRVGRGRIIDKILGKKIVEYKTFDHTINIQAKKKLNGSYNIYLHFKNHWATDYKTVRIEENLPLSLTLNKLRSLDQYLNDNNTPDSRTNKKPRKHIDNVMKRLYKKGIIRRH